MPRVTLILSLILLSSSSYGSMFGEETIPLMKLVAGQITEIERLSENLNIAKDQAKTLHDLNSGIERAVSTLESIQSILERAQGIDPSAVRSLADVNALLERAQSTQEEIRILIRTQIGLADQAIAGSALQSDTAYKMGQEMVATGAQLSNESQSASPGRAGQIAAAAVTSQMVAQGVELQTLSHLVQLQAMSLEFQKNQAAQSIRNNELQSAFYVKQLGGSSGKYGSKSSVGGLR